MKKKILLIIMILLSFSAISIATELDIFATIPGDHWTYKELKVLSQYGLLPENSLNKEFSRFEVGLLINHAIESQKDQLLTGKKLDQLVDNSLAKLVEEYKDILLLQPTASFNKGILDLKASSNDQLWRLEKELEKLQFQAGSKLSVTALGEYGRNRGLLNWNGLDYPEGETNNLSMEVLLESRPNALVSNEVTLLYDCNLDNITLQVAKALISIDIANIAAEIGNIGVKLSPFTLQPVTLDLGWGEYYSLPERHEMQEQLEIANLDEGKWPLSGLKITSSKDNLSLMTFGSILRRGPNRYLTGAKVVANLSEGNDIGLNMVLFADASDGTVGGLWNQVNSLELCSQSKRGFKMFGEIAYSRFDEDAITPPRALEGSAIKVVVSKNLNGLEASLNYRNVSPTFKSLGAQNFPVVRGSLNKSITTDFSLEQQDLLLNEIEPIGLSTPNRKGYEIAFNSYSKAQSYYGLRFIGLKEILPAEEAVPLRIFTGTGMVLGMETNRRIGFFALNKIELTGRLQQTRQDTNMQPSHTEEYFILSKVWGFSISGKVLGRQFCTSLDFKEELEKNTSDENIEKQTQALTLEYEIIKSDPFRLDLLARKSRDSDKFSSNSSSWQSFAFLRLVCDY